MTAPVDVADESQPYVKSSERLPAIMKRSMTLRKWIKDLWLARPGYPE
jgi:hypothetical protein